MAMCIRKKDKEENESVTCCSGMSQNEAPSSQEKNKSEKWRNSVYEGQSKRKLHFAIFFVQVNIFC